MCAHSSIRILHKKCTAFARLQTLDFIGWNRVLPSRVRIAPKTFFRPRVKIFGKIRGMDAIHKIGSCGCSVILLAIVVAICLKACSAGAAKRFDDFVARQNARHAEEVCQAKAILSRTFGITNPTPRQVDAQISVIRSVRESNRNAALPPNAVQIPSGVQTTSTGGTTQFLNDITSFDGTNCAKIYVCTRACSNGMDISLFWRDVVISPDGRIIFIGGETSAKAFPEP